MASVVNRIRGITQPRGGYLKLNDFEEIILSDTAELMPCENIHASLIGIVVDYLTRYISGAPSKEAFKIPLIGARIIDEEKKATDLLGKIGGLDDESIFCACKLAGYDVCYRAGKQHYKPVDEIVADQNTISNIRLMVNRSLHFMSIYGPVIKEGFTFDGGYSQVITSGDGDFLTKDTLWDFNVTKNKPNPAKRLQLLVYYLMGKRSIHPEFQNITKLGIYNPRLNIVYLIEVAHISPEIIEDVLFNIIGYTDSCVSDEAVSITAPCTARRESQPIEWTLSDLIARYGVGRQKITGDFIGYGLPHYRKGREYRFIPDEVRKWEIQIQSVPYGQKGEIILPAFVQYREYLKEELKTAKLHKDKQQINMIKQEMKSRGISYINPLIPVAVVFMVALLALLIGVIVVTR